METTIEKNEKVLDEKLHFIPKKYRHMVASDSYYAGREEGYWIFLERGYFSEEMGSQTIHENTQKDVMRLLRTVREITLRDAQGANYTDMFEELQAKEENVPKKADEFEGIVFTYRGTVYSLDEISLIHYQTKAKVLAIKLENTAFDWSRDDDIRDLVLTTNIHQSYRYKENEVTIQMSEFNKLIVKELVDNGWLIPTEKVGHSGFNEYSVFVVNFVNN